jgi:riboflavin synthase
MFTGIVQAIGEITAVARQGRDSRLTVAFRDLDCADVRIGDSIAMNGACMTVVALTPLSFQVDMSQESLQRTTRLDQIGPVNLEKAMSASDRFGGHLVSGHIDGVAHVKTVAPIGESWEMVVALPAHWSPYVSEKGSIALDGVSLTINSVHDHGSTTDISVNLIPHTWRQTTLHHRQPGDAINVEIDSIAKQIARVVERLQLKK